MRKEIINYRDLLKPSQSFFVLRIQGKEKINEKRAF